MSMKSSFNMRVALELSPRVLTGSFVHFQPYARKTGGRGPMSLRTATYDPLETSWHKGNVGAVKHLSWH